MPNKKLSKATTKRRVKKTRKPSFLHRYGVIGLLTLSILLQASSSLGGHSRVLSYATSMSVAGLQSAQNAKRTANNVASLALNSQLNNAAQAKANDMVARNYWSHNTPDGDPPWVFISSAGYSYYKAGENLAYGFDTSDGVINGWMNSTAHRANVLDPAYKDVGFGIANGSNYQGGENTVVVAMYGQPAAAVQAPPPAPAPPPATPTTPPATPKTPTPAPSPTPTPSPDPSPTPTAPSETSTNGDLNGSDQQAQDDKKKASPFTSVVDNNSQPPSTRASTIRSVLSGTARWTAYSSFLLTVVAGGWFVLKHTVAVKRVFVDGEDYVMTHPAFEVSLLSVAMLLLFVGTSGVIR